MSVTLEGLNPGFRAKLETLLKQLADAGIEMHVCAALRPPLEQARLWRQSRSLAEVTAAVAHLKSGGAHWLADLLASAGPCHGPPVTKSLPGLSWHQWGEAADSFWLVKGVAEWSVSRVVDGDNGYHALARLAPGLGLTAGGNWPSFKDWPHVQLRSAASPLDAGYSLQTIDAEMQRRWE